MHALIVLAKHKQKAPFMMPFSLYLDWLYISSIISFTSWLTNACLCNVFSIALDIEGLLDSAWEISCRTYAKSEAS
ncbi:hypothetical protein VIBHAR_06619 [Vibrio campbellii ATCC BAA-1116]|uniref:Uncharacterized protein n=1 Tax=Vibrio campbellii (strain ATCC BAA-1116) TaxID=2902295 RepID=A7N4F5_VIBC1|nr:hypothetical protein VIBHAR_06619 [Vibrio campbellii ATCC BAA-1116]